MSDASIFGSLMGVIVAAIGIGLGWLLARGNRPPSDGSPREVASIQAGGSVIQAGRDAIHANDLHLHSASASRPVLPLEISLSFDDRGLDITSLLEGHWGKTITIKNENPVQWIEQCYVKVVWLGPHYHNDAVGRDIHLEWMNPDANDARFCSFQTSASAFAFRQSDRPASRPFLAALNPLDRKFVPGDFICFEIGATSHLPRRFKFELFIKGEMLNPHVLFLETDRTLYDNVYQDK